MGQLHLPLFKKYVFFMNTCLEKYKLLAPFSHRLLMKFHIFSALIFALGFYRFLVEIHPKREPKNIGFSDQKTILSATLSFMFNLVTILVPFGALWLPFGSLLAHFWLTFGALWLTFGALGSLLAILSLDFIAFGPP